MLVSVSRLWGGLALVGIVRLILDSGAARTGVCVCVCVCVCVHVLALLLVNMQNLSSVVMFVRVCVCACVCMCVCLCSSATVSTWQRMSSLTYSCIMHNHCPKCQY